MLVRTAPGRGPTGQAEDPSPPSDRYPDRMSATDTAAPVRLPDLASPPADIAQALVDVPSVSGSEGPLADAVEAALRDLDHLEVLRHGNTVVARTHLGRPQRVVVAGHLDTVPVSLRSRNVPGRREERDGQEVVWGRGSVDMKGGVAVALHLAATLTHPGKDVTWVLYDNEEVAAHLNGLGRVLATHPDWLAGDLAVLGEPTASRIEGGCNGTLRLVLDVRGVTAHSARAWRGVNAVHAATPLIQRVATAPVHEVEVEGLVFRESFSVVGIQGGTATNSVPDACRLTVNYRFAPDLTALEALERALLVLAGHDPGPRPGRLPGGRPTAPTAQALPGRTGTMPGTVEVSSPAARAVLDAAPPLVVGAAPVEVALDDLCEGARPGLSCPSARELVGLVRDRGGTVGPKYGWTDVARFSAIGVPALNLGPGDPMLCHTDDEHCPVHQIQDVAEILGSWLS